MIAKSEYIDPFIESIYDLFSTMLRCEAKRLDNDPSGEALATEIAVLTGFSGPVRGTVNLLFPAATALAMVNRLLDAEKESVSGMVLDGVAELLNIVAGGAKAKLNTGDGASIIELSLPTVIRGTDFKLAGPSQSDCFEIPFTSELGPFLLRVALDFAGKRG